MQMNIRRKQNSALRAAGFICSTSSAQQEPVPSDIQFHLDLWLCFTFQNVFFDVGHTVFMLTLPPDCIPQNRPGAAEYVYILFIISSPLVLLQLLRRSRRSMPSLAVHLGVIAVVTAASIHLVVDSVLHRLLSLGYQLHLSISENPLMKTTQLSSLVELLFFFDQSMAQLLWCIPLFLVLFLYFGGCFCHRKKKRNIPVAAWMLVMPNTVYYWFLITERQTFILFTFTFFAMAATVMHQRRRGMVPNSNGLLMLSSFSTALILVGVWVIYLWTNEVLRRRHPGLIFLPQPSVVYTLHRRHPDISSHNHTS